MFRQEHPPGRIGLSDFSDMNGLGVTIAGLPLLHRIYHFRLAFSGFAHAHVVLGGESFVALAKARRMHCGHRAGCRSSTADSLSAAFRNLDRDMQEDLTRRHEKLCSHYGMTPTPTRMFTDERLLRGSRDFADLPAYRRFVDAQREGI
jgi:hypothetical protein